MILDTAAKPAMDAVYDADTPVLEAETAVLTTSQSSEDSDVEGLLDQDWLDALSEYDDAADQDVIDGAA
jgi:hypothetical protein